MPTTLITHLNPKEIEELRKTKNFYDVSRDDVKTILTGKEPPLFIIRPATEEPNTLYINYLSENRVRKIRVDVTEEGKYKTAKSVSGGTHNTLKALIDFASRAVTHREAHLITPPAGGLSFTPPPPGGPQVAAPPSSMPSAPVSVPQSSGSSTQATSPKTFFPGGSDLYPLKKTRSKVPPGPPPGSPPPQGQSDIPHTPLNLSSRKTQSKDPPPPPPGGPADSKVESKPEGTKNERPKI